MIETGNRNFWIAQSIGWSLMALSNILTQYIGGLSLKMLLINSLLPFLYGFLVTTIYRFYIKKYSWKNWSLSKMILMTISSTFVQTLVLNTVLIGTITLILDKSVFTLANFLGNVFVFGFILLAWNLIYFCIHYFNNWHYSEIEKWQLLAEMKDAELGSLKSQINPHFIFNAINNIRALILEDQEKAREMLLNFSDMFRYSLKHSDHSTVLLKEELEVVQQYLELLSIQFEDKLKYELKVEEQLLDTPIPPMILQMLIENAVKHGISQYKEGGIVQVHIHKGQEVLYLDVKNTGNLQNKASLGERLGVGLENIKKRLALIYNGKADFQMTEANNFVTASIKIPLV